MDGDVVCVQGCGEDGRRKILRLYWRTPLGWKDGFRNIISQGSESRDAKSCVSRGENRDGWMGISCAWRGDGEDGRRKILRLYKADAVGMEGWEMGDDK